MKLYLLVLRGRPGLESGRGIHSQEPGMNRPRVVDTLQSAYAIELS